MTRSELLELKATLEPFAGVATIFADRKPQHGDIIQAWEFTSGTAELRVSHCIRAAAALVAVNAALAKAA